MFERRASESRVTKDAPSCDLEAHVAGGFWPQVARVDRLRPCDAEVDELDASVRGKQNVAGLDVSVSDVEAVDVGEGRKYLV